MSRAFNLFTRAVLTFPYHDTQCGFKAFTRRAAQDDLSAAEDQSLGL